MIVATVIAALAAIGFSGSSLLALYGSQVPSIVRSYAIAVAAGSLLALAIGDLFPESLDLAGDGAVAGYVAGFALLFLIETFTKGHTHHGSDEVVHRHALMPFILGLAIHNMADGFAIGIGAEHLSLQAAALGFGVVAHQFPVGLSLAAVLTASDASPRVIARVSAQLGLLIPLVAILTAALPLHQGTSQGVLTGIAGGVLTYLATAHLLPEAQAEHPGRRTAFVFTATLLLVTLATFTVLGD